MGFPVLLILTCVSLMVILKWVANMSSALPVTTV